MAIQLATKFTGEVDELFSTESRKSIVTNQDFSWDGAKTIVVYKVFSVDMQDYARVGGPTPGNWFLYGPVDDLNTNTQSMTLRNDRSFTFRIDALDENETVGALKAATALARQIREKVIPEVDTYTFGQMCQHAGHKPVAKALTETNIYTEILAASQALDDALAPETGRCLVVTPAVYALMKKCKDITMECDIGNDMRLRGVISNLDGANVIKTPANWLPAKFGFMLCHSIATVAPTKLADYVVHHRPPGINGSLVEGRICYDAFILDNKAPAIYYQAQS